MSQEIRYIYNNDFTFMLGSIYSVNGIESDKFKGDILYVGMGSRYLESLHTAGVTSTTYIENSEVIIAEFGEGATIIQGDAFEVSLTDEFDIIFLDIWEKSELESELLRLQEKFKDNLKEGGKFLHLKSVFAADKKANK